jgi:predicted RNA binding protein YcfA (HicA-like mRNA interferase family)
MHSDILAVDYEDGNLHQFFRSDRMDHLDKISTTALSKLCSMSSKELFAQLENTGWIVRLDNEWELTQSGREQGGEVKKSDKFGMYIVWPAQMKVEGVDSAMVAYNQDTLLSASNIAELVALTARQVNMLLSELGWMSRHRKGWTLTPQGNALGGVQKENYKTAIPYVLWPAGFVHSRALERSVKAFKGDLGQALGLNDTADKNTVIFRQKYPANFRTADGHYVRSKAEMLIDNWLYMAGVTHAYERALPIEEDHYSTFYLPVGNIYIEYWGSEDAAHSEKIKQNKLDIYNKYNLNLTKLVESDVQHLDSVMPRLLLKHGIEI